MEATDHSRGGGVWRLNVWIRKMVTEVLCVLLKHGRYEGHWTRLKGWFRLPARKEWKLEMEAIDCMCESQWRR